MKRIILDYFILFEIFAILSGCAQVSPKEGFEEVQQQVKERTGLKVSWYTKTEEDQQVEVAIKNFLKDTLTLEEALQVTLLNNRRLQAMYEEMGIAQAGLVQAGLLKNPVFRGAILFPTSGAQEEYALSLVINFLDILFIPLRKALTTANWEKTRLQVMGAVLDYASKARMNFYQVQADYQFFEMQQQVVRATEGSYYASQKLHEAGNLTDLDVYREQFLHEQAKLDLAKIESKILQDRELLNTLMGLWGRNTQWQIETRLPEIPQESIDLTHIEKQAITKSIDLAIAKKEIEILGQRLGLTNLSVWFPNAELGAEAEKDDGDWEIGPSLSLTLPIFDQGQAKIALIEAKLRQEYNHYLALAIEIRSVARTIRDRLVNARRMVLHYHQILLPLQNNIVEQTQLQYNAMQAGVFELLQTKRQQIEIGQNYIEALQNYWQAYSALDQLLNGRLPEVDK